MNQRSPVPVQWFNISEEMRWALFAVVAGLLIGAFCQTMDGEIGGFDAGVVTGLAFVGAIALVALVVWLKDRWST